jgi:hypothetical protein
MPKPAMQSGIQNKTDVLPKMRHEIRNKIQRGTNNTMKPETMIHDDSPFWMLSHDKRGVIYTDVTGEHIIE